jgi:N-acetyl-beta-hexosaminidase
MGYRLQCAVLVHTNDQAIKLKLDEQLPQLGDEGYILDVYAGQILIRARQPSGLFYGIQQGFIDIL